MNAQNRTISSLASAMIHRIADGDPALLNRLQLYLLDFDNNYADPWHFLRVAEGDAWKSVELLLLRKMLERRFHDGELDAWVKTTLFGDDIRQRLGSFFDWHRSVEFPVEPKSFGAFAFQELRAARLAGALQAEPSHPSSSSPEQIVDQMAARLEGRFPLLAQTIRHPQVDLVGMTWFFLDFRIGINIETREPLPGNCKPSSNPGLADLAVLLVNWSATVEELLGDVYVQAEMSRRVRLTEMRNSIRDKSDDEEIEREAQAEIEAILGRAIPIRARTLAEAVVEAERIRATDDILVAQNSLWGWFNALPVSEREAIGQFKNKHRFWNFASFRHRRE